MIDLMQGLELTRKLMRARNAAKTLLGDKYQATMAEHGLLLSKVAKARNCSVIAAATECCGHVSSPFMQIELLAAAVELTEADT